MCMCGAMVSLALWSQRHDRELDALARELGTTAEP